jgi:hypothetical protein
MHHEFGCRWESFLIASDEFSGGGGHVMGHFPSW